MRDAYIVTSIRTPGCRRGKGAFKDTRPEDLLSFILSAAVDKTENLEKKDVEDGETVEELKVSGFSVQVSAPPLFAIVRSD